MEANQSSPEKASSAGDSTTQKQEAFTHLAQGKRHLLVRDYFEAATSLAQACKLLAEQYGECANEVGDAYFNYGKALLELARSESGVLGDAIEGDHDGSNEDDDEDEGEEEDGEEQTEENGTGNIENSKTEEEGEKGGDEGDKKDDSVENKEGEEQKGDTEGDENTDNDDESNLKLAWEVLELAKLIFQRQAEGNPKISLMLAEVYLKLGEVSLEDENYGQAIEDIKSCLKIQTENLPEDDRFVAETFYQLGVAYSLNSDFDNAIDNFKNAVNVIEKRIKNLEVKKKAGGDCAEETKLDPFYSLDGEIKELKSLLPEMQDKVTDMEDFKKETMKALCNNIGQRVAGQADGASGSGSSINSSQTSNEAKPVSNISHLVRKKRKPEETAGDNKD
ncbi:protein HGV2 isoform X2 [Anabrus simplex]|uniref:protein HGV2 isoform X2 n=1 Tax=Anabrus simplex TaxID=316456 RepID=UPI0035A2D7B7